MSRFSSALINLALVVCSTLVALLLGEAAVRVSQYARFSVSVFEFDNRGPLVADTQLGWRAMPNYRREGTWRDSAGGEYALSMSTDARGFRVFGDVSAEKPKILVIGDSYTHAIETSDGQAYFHAMAEALPFEFFVYGAGGYGTLQEYLALAEYWDLIDPDIVLIQYCGNDFSNNLEAYEAVDLANNNGLRRPYLGDNGEIYHSIAREQKSLWAFANEYSRLLAALLFRWEAITRQPPTQDELAIVRAEAIAITDRILGLIKKQTGEVPVYAFSTGSNPGVYDVFQELSVANDIVFIEGVAQALDEAERSGLVGRVADGAHWSPLGHKEIANPLIDFFRIVDGDGAAERVR